MEEKDRRIHMLEYKVQQLMRDTLTISEEQSRLQKENSTLLRALSKLTADRGKQSGSGPGAAGASSSSSNSNNSSHSQHHHHSRSSRGGSHSERQEDT